MDKKDRQKFILHYRREKPERWMAEKLGMTLERYNKEAMRLTGAGRKREIEEYWRQIQEEKRAKREQRRKEAGA